MQHLFGDYGDYGFRINVTKIGTNDDLLWGLTRSVTHTRRELERNRRSWKAEQEHAHGWVAWRRQDGVVGSHA